MRTLVKYKFFLNIIGLHPSGGFDDIIRRFILWLALFSIVLLSLICFVLDIDRETNKAWGAFCVFFGFMTHVLIYSYLVVSWKRIYSLLNDLQCIVDESRIRAVHFN